MKKRTLFSEVLLVGLWACPGPTPTPPSTTTTTTQPAEEPTFQALRLVTDGPNFVRPADPNFKFLKAVACCEATQGTGWPGLSESEVQFFYEHGQTVLHWRVGPFRFCNEPEWPGGGAYVEDVAGLADLTQFNESYFSALHDRIVQAGKLGMNVEVSLVDGWDVKMQQWASGPGPACWHPWHPQGNVQHQDHLTSAYRGVLDGVHTAFVNKVFETTVGLHNVIYEAGTETDQLKQTGRAGKDIVTFELTMEALLRQAEARHGISELPHLFGTNFVGDESFAWLGKNRLQYQNIHRMTPSAVPYTMDGFWNVSEFVRPLVMDEYNPDAPGISPEEMAAFACYTRANGSYWAAWRHTQADARWKASLSLIARDAYQGCSDLMKTGCPWTETTSPQALPVARVDCKQHSGALWDCTPKTARGGPVLPEGRASRGACEQRGAGLAPGQGVGWSTAAGKVNIAGRPNRWQFTVSGVAGATDVLRCKLPILADACHGQAVRVP